jgi:7tm Odorant receptor
MDFNFFLHFDLPIKALKVLGFWQTKENSRKYRLWGFISHFIFLELFLILPLIHLLKVQQIEEEALNFLFIYLATNFKMLNLLSKMESVKDLLSELKELLVFTKFELDSARLELKRHVKFMARLLVIFWGSVIFSASTDLNGTLFEHRLPYKMWIPYDHNNEFVFWITSVLEVFLTMVGSSIAVSLDLIPAFFMGMASNMLAELRERMKNLSVDTTTDKEKYRELVKCIEIHLRLKTFVKKIENCFSVTFFAQGFFSSCTICLTTFVLSTVNYFSSFLT